jgi:hypothetical protein
MSRFSHAIYLAKENIEEHRHRYLQWAKQNVEAGFNDDHGKSLRAQ